MFHVDKPLIGILSLLPLPGSANWKGRIDQVIARAEQEATAMATGGVDAILLENTFDGPAQSDRLDVAGAVALGLITRRVMHFTPLPMGISVLKNDPETALAIATNVGARFIRVPLLTGLAMWEGGFIEGRYRQLLAYKKALLTEGIAVYADISLTKHPPLANNIPQISLLDLARQAVEVGHADGIIITDPHITPEQVQELAQALPVPVMVHYQGSVQQAQPMIEAANGLLLSDAIKKTFTLDDELPPAVDLSKVETLSSLCQSIRQQRYALT